MGGENAKLRDLINETDYENLTGEPYAPNEEDNTDDQG